MFALPPMLLDPWLGIVGVLLFEGSVIGLRQWGWARSSRHQAIPDDLAE